jgi:hypothetical protein
VPVGGGADRAVTGLFNGTQGRSIILSAVLSGGLGDEFRFLDAVEYQIVFVDIVKESVSRVEVVI